jgi:mannose-6-phosphate isomerase-like protein (cupin superfamily)
MYSVHRGALGPNSRMECGWIARCASERSEMCLNAINLAAKLSTFSEHYKPRTVAHFNGHDVMVVKVNGPFIWHKHDETDDFFLVLKGRITFKCEEAMSA